MSDVFHNFSFFPLFNAAARGLEISVVTFRYSVWVFSELDVHDSFDLKRFMCVFWVLYKVLY